MRSILALSLAPLLAVLACRGGGGTSGTAATGSASVTLAPAYPAVRWVPAHPTYVLAGRTVKDAQHGLRDLVDAVGVLGGVGIEDAMRASRDVLQVDVFSPEPVAAMGIDLQGGIVAFSEDLNPTIVVHLTSAEQTFAFFDHQRDHGLSTQSVIVDGTEVFTARLGAGVRVSWAIDGEWLWTHFAFAFAKDDGTTWFRAKAPTAARPELATRWTWAAGASASLVPTKTPGLVGFADVARLFATLAAGVPDARACAKVMAPIQGVALAVESDGAQTAGRIAFDVGAAATAIQAHVLAPPAGWDAAAAKAALGVQWNLDLHALIDWLGPCSGHLGLDASMARVKAVGIKSARGFVEAIDLDNKSGRGAIAVDLSSATFLDAQLDRIPLRSTLEKDLTFGGVAGHRVSIPFGPDVDYILSDKLAMAAIGDGVLAAAVGTGPAQPGGLMAVDIAPERLPAATWIEVLKLARIPNAEAMVTHMLRWQRGHIGVAIDGTSLVLDARGARR